ncbi:MAG: hypothetical protein OJF48_003432 [Afipia sp.]|nr:MAG: hypothetical protein OJF48_003432 [Afipia sp.]
MSEKSDVFVGGWSDACQCPLCQSPFISNSRPHDPTPCKEPVGRVRLPRSNVQGMGVPVLEGARAC